MRKVTISGDWMGVWLWPQGPGCRLKWGSSHLDAVKHERVVRIGSYSRNLGRRFCHFCTTHFGLRTFVPVGLKIASKKLWDIPENPRRHFDKKNSTSAVGPDASTYVYLGFLQMARRISQDPATRGARFLPPAQHPLE